MGHMYSFSWKNLAPLYIITKFIQFSIVFSFCLSPGVRERLLLLVPDGEGLRVRHVAERPHPLLVDDQEVQPGALQPQVKKYFQERRKTSQVSL